LDSAGWRKVPFIFVFLWRISRRLERAKLARLVHPAHVVGIIIMLGIFAAWRFRLSSDESGDCDNEMVRSNSPVACGTDFQFGRWIFNIPHGVLYLLPWYFCRWCYSQFRADKDRQLARALAWGAIVPFVIVDLVPGSIPRYACPRLFRRSGCCNDVLRENCAGRYGWAENRFRLERDRMIFAIVRWPASRCGFTQLQSFRNWTGGND